MANQLFFDGSKRGFTYAIIALGFSLVYQIVSLSHFDPGAVRLHACCFYSLPLMAGLNARFGFLSAIILTGLGLIALITLILTRTRFCVRRLWQKMKHYRRVECFAFHRAFFYICSKA
jgi:branched-subunit amino acid ABC-type transport system permease component